MSNGTVVRMKITLDDVPPIVSRTLEVPLNIRLDRLHTVFFGVHDSGPDGATSLTPAA